MGRQGSGYGAHFLGPNAIVANAVHVGRIVMCIVCVCVFVCVCVCVCVHVFCFRAQSFTQGIAER